MADRRRECPGGDHRSGRAERHREAPRRAVADRDPDGRLRARAVLGRPAPGAQERGGDEPEAGAPDRSRPEPRFGPRGLAVGHHASKRGAISRADEGTPPHGPLFLLLVPIVLGAVVLKGYTDVVKGELPHGVGGGTCSSSARSRRPAAASSRSAGSSGMSAATTTPSSSSTGLPSPISTSTCPRHRQRLQECGFRRGSRSVMILSLCRCTKRPSPVTAPTRPLMPPWPVSRPGP